MARPASPVGLVAALLVACTAPLVAVAATGVARDHPADGRVETAAERGSDHSGETTTERTSPPGTGTADIPPSTARRARATTTTATAGTRPAPASAPLPTLAPGPGGTAPPPPTPAPAPTTPPVTSATLGQQVVTLVNQARAKRSPACPALRVDSRITKAAQAHSDDMAVRNYFSHDTPEGVDFVQRVENAGYPRPGGENIAKGQRTAQDVMSAWMQSSGHRANILNCDFVAIGVGVNMSAWTWTQDFGY